MRRLAVRVVSGLGLLSGLGISAAVMPPDADRQLAREIYKEMVEIRSGYTTGATTPVAEAVASNFSNLYVVNEDDNTIVQFAIGNDGKVYPQNTVNTPGVFPMGIAVNGPHLYVADTYQPLPACSPAQPCSGSVAVLPLSSSGQPGAAVGNGEINYWPLTAPCSPTDVLTPTAINAAPSGKYVFVSAYDATAAESDSTTDPAANTCDVNGIGTAPTGYVFAFSANSNGTLTAVSGPPFVVAARGTNGAGVNPSAIVTDPGSQYLYVADFAGEDIYGYTLSSGALRAMSDSPFSAGDQPAAIAVDSAGSYAYVANSLDNTITAYTIHEGALKTFGTFTVSPQPVAVLVDPSTDHFVYAAGYLASSVSGYQLMTDGGTPTLVDTQASPYTGNAQMTAMTAIPHGSTAKQ